MAWTRDKLTDVGIRATKPAERLRKLVDGKGLQLWVTPDGGRYWRYEYRHLGKRKLLSLGIYPDLTLEKARAMADDARRQLKDGNDPSDLKRQKKAELRLAADNTFAKVYSESLKVRKFPCH